MKMIVPAIVLGCAFPIFAQGSKKPPAKKAMDRVHASYVLHQNLRAARVLRKVRFQGDRDFVRDKYGGRNTRFSYIEFSDESNSIAIMFNGETRRGKIIKILKGKASGLNGEYLLETWKPQQYAGFERGPSRTNFKQFRVKWRVKIVHNKRMRAKALFMKVYSRDRRAKLLHNYVLLDKNAVISDGPTEEGNKRQ